MLLHFTNPGNTYPYTCTEQWFNPLMLWLTALSTSLVWLFLKYILFRERNYPPKLSFAFPCFCYKSALLNFERNCHAAQYLCPIKDCIEDYYKAFKEKIQQNNNLVIYFESIKNCDKSIVWHFLFGINTNLPTLLAIPSLCLFISQGKRKREEISLRKWKSYTVPCWPYEWFLLSSAVIGNGNVPR